jgi:putative sterol carrier protein
VRGRSDEQLDRLVGSDAGLRLIFKGMESAFLPEKADGFRGDIQYELDSRRGTRRWHLHVSDARAEAREGAAAEPAVTYRASVALFARLIARDVNPAKALLEEELQIEGDYRVAMRMEDWFGQTRAW